jgi:hypothetical protein
VDREGVISSINELVINNMYALILRRIYTINQNIFRISEAD